MNRALIRDEITSIEVYKGITGDIILDGCWNNVSTVWMAEIKVNGFIFWEYQWAYPSENAE